MIRPTLPGFNGPKPQWAPSPVAQQPPQCGRTRGRRLRSAPCNV